MSDLVTTSANTLMSVEHLRLELPSPAGNVTLLDDVSFVIHEGEVVGLVGESGSGKTLTGLCMLGLEPAGAVVTGSVAFRGEDLLAADGTRLRQIRGREIGMIFQENRAALNPCLTIGRQIAGVVRAHFDVSRADALQRAVDLLERVKIPQAKARANSYPHELSGGMCQRAMIAMALVCGPKLLIADEPTTALDVTIQAQIVNLVRELADDTDMAVLLISHNLGVVCDIADRVVTMYAGEVVNDDGTHHLVHSPSHPYTWGLVRSATHEGSELGIRYGIGGRPPSVRSRPRGCRFQPRCEFATTICVETHPEIVRLPDGSMSRCWLSESLKLEGVPA